MTRSSPVTSQPPSNPSNQTDGVQLRVSRVTNDSFAQEAWRARETSYKVQLQQKDDQQAELVQKLHQASQRAEDAVALAKQCADLAKYAMVRLESAETELNQLRELQEAPIVPAEPVHHQMLIYRTNHGQHPDYYLICERPEYIDQYRDQMLRFYPRAEIILHLHDAPHLWLLWSIFREEHADAVINCDRSGTAFSLDRCTESGLFSNLKQLYHRRFNQTLVAHINTIDPSDSEDQ